jgi:DNA-binding NarL/FixJ family response regulator
MADRATNRAAPDRGLGLYIVDAIATAWNTTRISDGKIVWALLRARPLGAPRDIDNPASTPPRPHGAAPTAESIESHHDGRPATRPGSARRQPRRGEELTDREVKVLGYLPTKLTAGEIAAEVHVSVDTARACMRSIYTKLDVSRRQDAVRRAYERGLLS